MKEVLFEHKKVRWWN